MCLSVPRFHCSVSARVHKFILVNEFVPYYPGSIKHLVSDEFYMIDHTNHTSKSYIRWEKITHLTSAMMAIKFQKHCFTHRSDLTVSTILKTNINFSASQQSPLSLTTLRTFPQPQLITGVLPLLQWG